MDDLPVATIRPKGSGVQRPLGIAVTGGSTANNTGSNSVANPVNVDVFYLHPDHLGTLRVSTRSVAVGGATSGPNAINKAVWRWDSDPFGTSLDSSKPVENPQLVAGTASQVTAASFRVSNRFPGQQFDIDSGKQYNYFRDYDPSIGRYVESDPIGLKGGLNSFAYVGQRPIRKSDPLGLFTFDEHFSMTLAAMQGVNYPRLSAMGLAWDVMAADIGTQGLEDSYRHSMKLRKRAGLKGHDSFKIRRNAQLYITSIYAFGAGIGHLQDADCEVEGNGCCATATCKLKFSAIDRYSDPIDMCQRWGGCGGAQNVGGTTFWFGLGCNGSYSSTACK